MEHSGTNYRSAPYSSIGSTVGYGLVNETRSGAGETSYVFMNRPEITTSDRDDIITYQTPEPDNGKLLTMSQYDHNGTLVRSESNQYSSVCTHSFWGISLEDKFNRSPGFYPDLVTRSKLLDLGAYPNRFTVLAYGVNSWRTLLTNKTVTEDGVTTTHDYTYDDNAQVVRDEETRSDGTTQATSYTYPYDYDVAPYTDMAAKHMLAYPVEVRQSANGVEVNSKLTQYSVFGNNLRLPSSVSSGVFPNKANGAATFTDAGADLAVYPYADASYLKYDGYGNPVDFIYHGEETLVIWSYGGQYPVAEIKNSTYDIVKNALGRALEDYSPYSSASMADIDALRQSLPNALITTYEWKPLVGLTSVTAPDGTVTTYEYDSFGRLIGTRDNDGNIVVSHDYHYAGSDTGTPVTPPTPPQTTDITCKISWSSAPGSGSIGFSIVFSKSITGNIAVDFNVMTSSGNPVKKTINYTKGFSGTGTSFSLGYTNTQAVAISATVRKLDSSDPSTYTVTAVKQ